MPGNPTIELWTLYAVAVSFTALRTYARISAVGGLRDLHPDDYLIWLAVLIYTAQCSLGYNVGAAAHGLANNGMTDAERSALSPDSPEYTFRVIGSKIQVAGWSTSVCLLWTLKLCMTFFYKRLTSGLNRYHIYVYIAMGLIGTTFIINIMTIFLSCRPFNHYWQINPNPGNVCQASISRPIIWVSFVTNVSTDIMLLLIPLPMLWKSRLRLLKKIATTFVLSAGVLIIAFAITKSIYVIVDPVEGGQLAAEWGTRETFIAVITTSLPNTFPLFKTWFAPLFASRNRSTSGKNAYKKPSNGFVTIGGGGGGSSSRNRGSQKHNQSTVNTMSLFTNTSEEHFAKGNDEVMMQHLDPTARSTQHSANAIVVSKQVSVTTEDGQSKHSSDSFQRV